MGFLLIAVCAQADVPWFDDVTPAHWSDWYQPGAGYYVSYPVFSNPANCLGAPAGGEVYAAMNSFTIGYFVTLGDRDPVNNKGWLILGFSSPITDNPKNAYGLDFIVFSNTHFVNTPPLLMPPYSDPTYRWQEPAFVEISQDLVNWYLIRPNILPADLVPGPEPNADTGMSTTMLRNYAEYTPSIHLPTTTNTSDPFYTVTRTNEELYTVPERPSLPAGYNTVRFDYVSGGGDAMDIADAVVESSPGVPAHDAFGHEIKANISQFSYIRMTDAVAGDYYPGLNEISAEIDTVSRVRPAMSIGEAKGLAEGGYALVTEAIVTAVTPTAFYVESPDRSAAMKVIYNTGVAVDGVSVAVGDKMTVTGHITKAGGEFALPDPMWSCTSIGNSVPAPLAMSVGSLGTSLAYGLRVRVCGKVTDRGTGYCVIKDGGSSVKITWTGSYTSPGIDAKVCVTGICDREEGTGAAIILSTNPVADVKAY